ncbi:MAG: ATP-binding protein [Phycisphaerae bacterium]|nr:ATP-binding protein [Phycisphaerae bacterium]
MIARHLSATLRAAARKYPVVTLTGPRQSGKTTLARAAFPGHEYVSLEDPGHRSFALEDPRGFLARFKSKVILDEVQRVPDLFSYIQGVVDERDRAGQFILTGSQNFLLLQKVTQSLAGRCSVLHLLPFSRSELTGSPRSDPTRLGRVPRGGRRIARRTRVEASLFEMMLTGFYPRIHDKQLDPQEWLANYYQTYLERDARDLLNVGDINTFGRFVRLCAGRSGQVLELSGLASDAGVSHTTARRWLSVLEASFVVFLLRPYHRNFNKRIIKSPKLYFVDTGLLCYLLRIRNPEELSFHAGRGPVFETWVVSEVLKLFHNRGQVPDVYFWRDSNGREVDLLIDLPGNLMVVEVKSGQTVASDFLKDLKQWKALTGCPDARAVLVYGGDESYTRQDVSMISWKDWA